MTVQDYLDNVIEERKPFFNKLRQTIIDNLPEGFHEEISYGMIGYVVPHDIYPNGYHVKPELPLPYMNIASQKSHVALYHSGIFSIPELNEWFQNEYPNHCKYKINMSKSCVRLKKMEDIPFELIAELIKKISVQDYIKVYEEKLK